MPLTAIMHSRAVAQVIRFVRSFMFLQPTRLSKNLFSEDLISGCLNFHYESIFGMGDAIGYENNRFMVLFSDCPSNIMLFLFIFLSIHAA